MPNLQKCSKPIFEHLNQAHCSPWWIQNPLRVFALQKILPSHSFFLDIQDGTNVHTVLDVVSTAKCIQSLTLTREADQDQRGQLFQSHKSRLHGDVPLRKTICE